MRWLLALKIWYERPYHPLGDQWSDIRTSSECLTNGKCEFGGGAALKEITGRSELKCFRGKIWILVHCQIYQFYRWYVLFEFLSCADAIHQRHTYIENNDVRVKVLYIVDKSPAVQKRTDHFEFRFQKAPKSSQKERMIICQNYAWAFHVPAPFLFPDNGLHRDSFC